ncbi:putative metal-binding membrane protein [Rhodovulum iodosum]|uniref:Metal-binding membrane protein n=1 Tax=Rhodovulum iodosum TaxID=68291 RepID=A0ABV3XX04_9RHOB
MNLYWIILLAVLVLAEKLLASGRTAGMMTGAVLIA